MMKQMKVYKFFDQVKQEARKVIWPEKKDLFASVGVVIVAVIIFSLACLVMDYSIHNVMRFLLNIGK